MDGLAESMYMSVCWMCHVTARLPSVLARQHAGGGEIIDHIAKMERLPEPEARKYFREMVSAIGMFSVHA